MIQKRDFSIVRGDTNIITFTLLGENGDVYVVDEADKIYFTVKENANKKTALIQKTLDNGITFNTDTQEYEITLDSDATSSLSFATYVYDIEIIIVRENKSITKTIVEGNITISEEVTHKENEI